MARKANKRSNGEGSVTKRKDGRWEVDIPVGIDPVTGKRKRFRAYAKSSTEANAMRIKVLRDLQTGAFIDSENITVGEWLDIWLDTYIKSKVRPNTCDNYSMLIKKHLKPTIGKVSLKKLTTIQIQRLYNEKLMSGRVDGQGGLSIRSVEKIHTVLHKALKQALTENRVYRNASEGAVLPTRKQHSIRVLTNEERIRFEGVLEGDRLGRAFLLDLYSGLRRGELLALRWTDVNFEQGTLQVNRSLVRIAIFGEENKTQLSFQDPKTVKSNRTVAIPMGIMAELKKHKALQNEEKLKAGEKYEDQNLVFCTRFGLPLEPRNFNRKFADLLTKAKISDFNLHGLRHTYATILLEEDVHPKIVQEALGHSKISTTLDIYSHVSPEIMRKAADVLDVIYKEKKSPSKAEGQ